MWASPVDPTNAGAGLLLCTYYGRVYHLPLIATGDSPQWGAIAEMFTMHNEPFNRATNFDINIGVSDALEPGRFDIFAGDRSQSPSWSRLRGHDAEGRPIYDTPKKIKQHNPHVGNSFFSVPTVGDWRGTGTPDLVVGGVEGYVLWYKTLSTDPLRFALPERVRSGTTEIRRLAAPNPAGGHHWGGSQGPYDGDTGGYSNPVLVDWNGNGLLDLLVSDMIGLYDWYPNWGTKAEPELGPPQRLHVTDGEPLRGPWRQQAGVGDFSVSGIPDVVIQDTDLDLALFRRVGPEEPSLLHPGEKLRYEDGETIKTHGVYTAGGGDGRGRTKINVVDWDGDGVLDLLLGVGPQHGSPYRGSYVLFAKNVGSNGKPRLSDVPKSSCGMRTASHWSSGGTASIQRRSTGTATASSSWSPGPTRGVSGTGNRNTLARARPAIPRRPNDRGMSKASVGTIEATHPLGLTDLRSYSYFELGQANGGTMIVERLPCLVPSDEMAMSPLEGQ